MPSLLAAVAGFMVWLTPSSVARRDRYPALVTTPPTPARRRLRIGFVPGVTLTKWRTVWKERFPRVPLDVIEVSEADQRQVLDAGEVDLCFVRLPVDPDGLHVIPLYEEVPVAWIAKDHPLADLDSVARADLADQEVFEAVDPHTIDLVVLTGAVLIVPMSIARTHSRRDLVYRPVTDAPATTIGLAWLQDDPHELADEWIGVVRGRTANSSRTAQDRTARGKEEASKPRPSTRARGHPRRGRPRR